MLFCYFLFFFCFVLVFFYHSHYMYLLLLLEGLLLSIFVFLCCFFMNSYGLFGLFIYLLVMVCMGGFSVSLLVSVARACGRDFWYFFYIF